MGQRKGEFEGDWGIGTARGRREKEVRGRVDGIRGRLDGIRGRVGGIRGRVDGIRGNDRGTERVREKEGERKANKKRVQGREE